MTLPKKYPIMPILAAALLLAAYSTACAEPSFEIDLKELDKPKASVAPKQAPPTKKPAAARQRRAQEFTPSVQKHRKQSVHVESGGGRIYTIKPGDHIFKILMRNFGMANEEAEALIPEVIRVNRISNIRALEVGRKIVIPTSTKHSYVSTAEKNRAGSHTTPQVRSESPAPEVAPVSPPEKEEAAAPAESTVTIATAVRSVTNRDQSDIVDAMLNILSVRWSKNHILETSPANGESPSFSVKVDRYFEYNGDRYMISFAENDPFTYTLLRLLEVQGVKLVRPGAERDLRTIAAALLSSLKITYDYGDHTVILNDKNHTRTTIKGTVFTRETTPARVILVTDSPVAALSGELVEEQKDQR